MNSDKSNDEEDAISSPILNYYRKFSQNKDLPKYFRGTSLSYMPQIVPASEQVPEIQIQPPPNEEDKVEGDKMPSPTSSVTSNRKLEWDNGADIGYENLESHSLLQKSHSLPILTPPTADKSLKSNKSIERITISSSSPSNSNDLIEAIIQSSSSDSFPAQNPILVASSSSSYNSQPVYSSDSSKKTSVSYLKERIGSPEAESTPKYSVKTDSSSCPQTPFVRKPEKPPRKLVTNSKLDLTGKKVVNLSMTKPISIECLNEKKFIGTNKKVQTNNVEKVTKSIQTDQDFNLIPIDNDVKDNQSVILIDCIESETEKTTQTDYDLKGSKCNSFEYVPGDELRSSNPASSQTIESKSTNSPVEQQIIQKQSKNLISDIDKTINVLQKLVKSKKYNSATKKRYIKKIVQKILDNNYIEDSTTSSELFRPKKPEPTQLSGSSSDGNVQPKLQDNIPWYPAPRTKNFIVKTFSDEILPQSANDRLKRNCFTLTNNEFQIETPSTSTSLEKNRSTSKSSECLSWKLDKTKSEHLLEQKKMHCYGKGDHLVEFAQKERRNQIQWIKGEISHLSKLRMLLEKNPNQHLPVKVPVTTTTVYMLRNSSSSSSSGCRNYVIQTELESSSSAERFDLKLKDEQGKQQNYVVKEDNGRFKKRRIVGDIEVVSNEKTTNIKVKACCVKDESLVDVRPYDTYPRSTAEARKRCFSTCCSCEICKRYGLKQKDSIEDGVNDCPYVFCYKNKNLDIERKLDLQYQSDDVQKKFRCTCIKQDEDNKRKSNFCTDKEEQFHTYTEDGQKIIPCPYKSGTQKKPESQVSTDFQSKYQFTKTDDEVDPCFRKIPSSSDDESDRRLRAEKVADELLSQRKLIDGYQRFPSSSKDQDQQPQTIPYNRFNDRFDQRIEQIEDKIKMLSQKARDLSTRPYRGDNAFNEVEDIKAREADKPSDYLLQKTRDENMPFNTQKEEDKNNNEWFYEENDQIIRQEENEVYDILSQHSDDTRKEANARKMDSKPSDIAFVGSHDSCRPRYTRESEYESRVQNREAVNDQRIRETDTLSLDSRGKSKPRFARKEDEEKYEILSHESHTQNRQEKTMRDTATGPSDTVSLGSRGRSKPRYKKKEEEYETLSQESRTQNRESRKEKMRNTGTGSSDILSLVSHHGQNNSRYTRKDDEYEILSQDSRVKSKARKRDKVMKDIGTDPSDILSFGSRHQGKTHNVNSNQVPLYQIYDSKDKIKQIGSLSQDIRPQISDNGTISLSGNVHSSSVMTYQQGAATSDIVFRACKCKNTQTRDSEVCFCKDQNIQTGSCMCLNVENGTSTRDLPKDEINQTEETSKGESEQTEISSTFTSTSYTSSDKVCSCCKQSSTLFSLLKNKLNNEIYQLCRSCYQQYGKLPINYNSPNHVCNCYTIVQTQTLYQIKQTINELNDIERKHCTCRDRKSTYCQYCNCKLKKTSKNKNGLAYVLTFEPEPIRQEKKKKKKQSLEEIRIKIPVLHKKRHKEKVYKKRKNDSDSGDTNPYSLHDYLVINRPNFVENAEGRRKYVQETREEREKNQDLNKLCFLQNNKSEKKHLYSSKEMKQINKKNYKKLPEVQRKVIDNRERQVRLANRLIVDTFNRKLRENVLKGKRNLPINAIVVNL